jgi:hypothetical protein
MAHARKKYLCVKVRQNNGVIAAQFMRDEDGQEEIILINELCAPDKYKEGLYYWWSSEGAFPQR